MSLSPFDVGDPWVITVEIHDPLDDDALVDTDTVVITVKAPDDTLTTPSVQHVSEGIYRATHPELDQSGHWHAISQASGDYVATEPERIYVNALPFDPNA